MFIWFYRLFVRTLLEAQVTRTHKNLFFLQKCCQKGIISNSFCDVCCVSWSCFYLRICFLCLSFYPNRITPPVQSVGPTWLMGLLWPLQDSNKNLTWNYLRICVFIWFYIFIFRAIAWLFRNNLLLNSGVLNQIKMLFLLFLKSVSAELHSS